MTEIKIRTKDQLDVAEKFEEFESREVIDKTGNILFDLVAVEKKKTKEEPYKWDVLYVNPS